MMPNFERNLRQTCTYWAQTALNMSGKGTFATPVQLPCRWEDVAHLFLNKRGQEVTSRSRVFLAQDIDLQGYLMLGTSAAADPTTLVDAWEIQQVKVTPDLRNLKNLYVAML